MTEATADSDFRNLPMPEIEARIARFKRRVGAAQKAHPPTKDWVRKAFRGEGDGRCPVRINRLSLDIIVRYGDDLTDLFCEFPDDVLCIYPYEFAIGYQPADKADRINPVEVMMSDARWTDEWGVGWGHAFGGVGARPVEYPLTDWAQLDDYLKRVPDARAPGRLDAAGEVLSTHGHDTYCMGVFVLGPFERLHTLRHMENLFLDFHDHPREVQRLLDVVEDHLLETIRWWAELGADAIYLTDDWGSQLALLISPAMWREFFKPRYTRIFAEMHRLGMDVFFHSCGNITQIVGDLIEAGVDILDPIQPVAMDVKEMARQFGGRIAFSGAIDDQELLCRGTPQQVKDTVREMIDTLGRPTGGRYMIAPANAMVPDIPLQNVQAFFEAAHDQ